jgi:hypothetical protein
MRNAHLFVSSLLAMLCLGCHCDHAHANAGPPQDSSNESAHSPQATAAEDLSEPENLYPQNPAYLESEQRICDALLGDVSTSTWMVCMESMGTPWAIALLPPSDSSEENATLGAPSAEHWTLLLVGADDDLDGPDSAAHVWRRLIPLDPGVASVVSSAWHEVVGRTRYQAPIRNGYNSYPPFDWLGPLGSDGATYLFGSDRYRGQIWSPSLGLPGDIVKLAEALAETATDDPVGAASRMQLCHDRAERLLEAARARPW